MSVLVITWLVFAPSTDVNISLKFHHYTITNHSWHLWCSSVLCQLFGFYHHSSDATLPGWQLVVVMSPFSAHCYLKAWPHVLNQARWPINVSVLTDR